MLMIKEAEKRKKMMCPQDQKEKGEKDKGPENNNRNTLSANREN